MSAKFPRGEGANPFSAIRLYVFSTNLKTKQPIYFTVYDSCMCKLKTKLVTAAATLLMLVYKHFLAKLLLRLAFVGVKVRTFLSRYACSYSPDEYI